LAVRFCQKSPDIGAFVVGGVVPDNMNDALVGVARLDLGEQLRGTDAIDGGGLNEGRGTQLPRRLAISRN